MSKKHNKLKEFITIFVDDYFLTPMGILIAFMLFACVLIFTAYFVSGSKYEARKVCFTASEYDLDAMAEELGIEPEYVESKDRSECNYISSEYNIDKGEYEYHYVIFTSDDEAFSIAEKYRIRNSDT